MLRVLCRMVADLVIWVLHQAAMRVQLTPHMTSIKEDIPPYMF